MMLKLYLIAYTDDDGNSYDSFVWAESTLLALALWLSGNTLPDLPDSVRAFQVPTAPPAYAKVLKWFEEVGCTYGEDFD